MGTWLSGNDQWMLLDFYKTMINLGSQHSLILGNFLCYRPPFKLTSVILSKTAHGGDRETPKDIHGPSGEKRVPFETSSICSSLAIIQGSDTDIAVNSWSGAWLMNPLENF